jgi:hypothetical protein
MVIAPIQRLTVNFSGRVRRDVMRGRAYLVAPMTLINPGVLNGSKGPLLYPPDEIAKNPGQWNGVPITVYHPHRLGQPVSAAEPGVLDAQGVGEVRNATSNGKLRAEGWFDVAKIRRVNPVIYRRLLANEQIELSTGLYTDNVDQSGTFNGRQYVAVARNYRPDHLAILPDQVGACSVSDGCGVLVNKENTMPVRDKLDLLLNSNPEGHNQYTESGGGKSDKSEIEWPEETTDESLSGIPDKKPRKRDIGVTGAGFGPMGAPKRGSQKKNCSAEANCDAVKNEKAKLIDSDNPIELKTDRPETRLQEADDAEDAAESHDAITGKAKSPAVKVKTSVEKKYQQQLGDAEEENDDTEMDLNSKLGILFNTFCSTGAGGGQDNSCGREGGGSGGENIGKNATLHARKLLKFLPGATEHHDLSESIWKSNEEKYGPYKEYARIRGSDPAKAEQALLKAGFKKSTSKRDLRLKGSTIYKHPDGIIARVVPASKGTKDYPAFPSHIDLTTNSRNALMNKLDILVGNWGGPPQAGGPRPPMPPQAPPRSPMPPQAGPPRIPPPAAPPAAAQPSVDPAAWLAQQIALLIAKFQEMSSGAKPPQGPPPGPPRLPVGGPPPGIHNQRGGRKMANVRLTVEEREAVVNSLVTNGACCWEESDREVLNGLNDVTLAKLHREMELIANAEGDGIGKFDPDGAGADQLDEDSDDDVAVEEEKTKPGTSQADGKDKPFGELDPKMKTNALNDQDRRDLAFARRYRMAQRAQHVQVITANENNQFTPRQLALMDDGVLANLAALARNPEDESQPLPSFFGAQGAAVVNADAGVDDEPLTLGRIDYKELAAGNGRA